MILGGLSTVMQLSGMIKADFNRLQETCQAEKEKNTKIEQLEVSLNRVPSNEAARSEFTGESSAMSGKAKAPDPEAALRKAPRTQ